MRACATVYRAPLVLLLKRFCYSSPSLLTAGHGKKGFFVAVGSTKHIHSECDTSTEDRPLLPSPQNIATSIITPVVASEAARAAPDTSVDGLVVGADGLVVGADGLVVVADGGAGGQPML